MSGLVAVLGSSKDNEVVLKSMADRLRFRGPYLRKEIVSPRYCMGCLDNKPSLKDESPRAPVVLDGYIYVVQDDNTYSGYEGEERIMKLWKEYGSDLFQYMEGEFTFALETPQGNILIARDPLGVKPLYYAAGVSEVYFASEIKALVETGLPIYEVPPGSYSINGREWISFYEVSVIDEDKDFILENTEKKLQDIMFQSIREKIHTESRFGVYLSGGLDSSVIASIATEVSPTPITTFTVGIKGSQDVDFARQVAEKIGSKHHEYIYDLEEILEVLPDVIYHLESFDCAYVRSSIPNFIGARLAKEEGREVLLTGEGADEIFAGYSYLKQLDTSRDINREISGFIKNLSSTGLQRVDRMNSAHGLKCRVPFLKTSLVELTLKMPLKWKLKGYEKDPLDKWILRRAFESYLGEKVAWREKQQFDQGSGSSNLLAEVAEREITDEEFAREAKEVSIPVRNKEELYYYRIFRNFYPEEILPLVGRWARTS